LFVCFFFFFFFFGSHFFYCLLGNKCAREGVGLCFVNQQCCSMI
jgi:hypothetical protein